MWFELFLLFFRLSLLAFGGVYGVMPELERMLVTERGWITHDQFVQAFVIGQFVPGPNMAMCPVIGYWIHGWSGFTAAFLGIYTFPTFLMVIVYRIYTNYRSIHWVRRLELGTRPVVIGLIGSSALRLWWMQSESHRVGAAVLTGIGFFLLLKKWLRPVPIILASGAVWWVVQWFLRRQ